MSGPVLRDATEADVPTLLSLIRGLAEYEHLAEHALATPDLLRRHLFGPVPRAHAVLAWSPGDDDVPPPGGAAGPRPPAGTVPPGRAPSTGPAERDGPPAGFALYFFAFSTFTGRPTLYLEDLFVRPEHRGCGMGRALLSELARRALGAGCARMDWAALRWNAPALGFYHALGARTLDDWTSLRLDGAALSRLAVTPGATPTT